MAKQVFLKEMVNGAGSMIAPLDIGEVYTVITKEDRMFPVKIETNGHRNCIWLICKWYINSFSPLFRNIL